MADAKEKEHTHKGMSSRCFLDANRIIGGLSIKIGDTFLDVGCGDGYFSLAASPYIGLDMGMVYALDVDEDAINALKKVIREKEIPNIDTIVADASNKMPLFDESIDITFMSNILHGFVANGQADRVMEEVTRVTRHGGRLVVIEFKKQESPTGPPLSIRLSPEDLDRLTGKYGFRRILEGDVGPYSYLAMFQREGACKPEDERCWLDRYSTVMNR
jgi:ubiquinone/menaquinone biosynthesis C-methylase UbiE